MGDTEDFNEQFRGIPTVYAVFEDLQTNMGLASGAQVLFGGCSAGGASPPLSASPRRVRSS